MEGHLLEGSDVRLSCKSSDGSEPIYYKWERVLDKGKSVGKLPEFALIGEYDMYTCSTERCTEHRGLLYFLYAVEVGSQKVKRDNHIIYRHNMDF